MELFAEPLKLYRCYLQEAEDRGALRLFCRDPRAAWPEGRSLVLGEDTAIELGGPFGSNFALLWTGRPEALHSGQVTLVGPEPGETGQKQGPLTLVVIACGDFRDEYETYQALQDLVFGTAPRGVSMRFQPESRKTWCRISREAFGEGFSLARYGQALLNSLTTLPAARGAQVIISTEATGSDTLPDRAGRRARAVTETLAAIYDDLVFDCKTCTHREVCTEVEGLKEIHRQISGEHGQR